MSYKKIVVDKHEQIIPVRFLNYLKNQTISTV